MIRILKNRNAGLLIGFFVLALAVFLSVGGWSVPGVLGTHAGNGHGPELDRKRPPSGGIPSGGRTADARILAAAADLASSAGEDGSMRILARLRADLGGMKDREATAAAILEFLEKGDDAATRLPFKVGAGGVLAMAPSLRVALLDILPSIDPDASVAASRRLFDRTTSQDEYALALRNLAWDNAAGEHDEELVARFGSMIHGKWKDAPGTGFLEAFDLPVELGDRRLFSELSTLASESVADSREDVGHAAFLALDRMILRDPSLIVSYLTEDAAWLEDAPEQRACLVARMGLDSEEERKVFVDYLNQADERPEELGYFSEIFPNQNYAMGDRLLTTDSEAKDLAALETARRKLLGEIKALRPGVGPAALKILDRIQQRLEEE